jgi:hypothetical protein
MIVPAAAVGDGRTYASAARNPGVLVSSGSSELFEVIEGVLNFAFRFPGFTTDLSTFSRALSPVCSSKDAEDSFDGAAAPGERGSGMSSREKIERSSPFHLSPNGCVFCFE